MDNCPNCNRLERLLSQMMSDALGRGFEAEGYPRELGEKIGGFAGKQAGGAITDAGKAVKKRTSPYTRKYKAAFKKVSKKYKLKSGKWAKNGFKRAVKEAHRIAGGKK